MNRFFSTTLNALHYNINKTSIKLVNQEADGKKNEFSYNMYKSHRA